MKRKILAYIIFMFILVIFFNSSLAYSNLSYSIDIPSNYNKVGDNSFSSAKGHNINIQIVYYKGTTSEKFYTEERLNKIVNDMSDDIDTYKEEMRKKLKEKNEKYGNSLTEEEINQYADSYRIDSVEKKEITTFSKNNYKCFHIITKFTMGESSTYSNQYIVLLGNYIYTLTISAEDSSEFDSVELVNTINSFTIKEDKNTYDESPAYWTLFLDFIITVIAYEFLPFFLKVIKRKEYSKKNSAIISTVNSVVIKGIILWCHFFLVKNDENNKALFDFAPAFVYGTINYYWLKSKIEKNKSKKNSNKTIKEIQNKEENNDSDTKGSVIINRENAENNKSPKNADIINVEPIKEFEDFEEITIAPKSNYCSKCGKKVKEDWIFCNNCGNKI